MAKPSLALKSKAFSREIAPESHRLWLEAQANGWESLEKEFGEWVTEIATYQSMFKTHVYENQNLNQFDLRQHLACLCALINNGENLVMDFARIAQETGKIPEAELTIAAIDQRIKELLEVLFAWHAPLKSQSDIPESFKRAAQEIEEGKIVDLDL